MYKKYKASIFFFFLDNDYGKEVVGPRDPREFWSLRIFNKTRDKYIFIYSLYKIGGL